MLSAAPRFDSGRPATRKKEVVRMTFEEAIRDCKNRPLSDFIKLEKSKGAGMYCCPICGSGTGENKTGALKVDKNTHRVTCFSKGCFGDKGEDTPGALAKIWKCSLTDAMIRAGYQIHERKTAPAPAQKAKRETTNSEQTPKKTDYTANYKEWHTILLQDKPALDFLHQRGITDEAIEHFHLGYAPQWVHPSNEKYKNPKKEARVIFPRSRSAYSARTLDPAEKDKYKVIDQKSLFNVAAIKDTANKFPIIAVEGEIDAILLWQLGITEVIALGSTNNKDRFIEAAKKYNPAAVYILALDNDKAGQEAQNHIAQELDSADIAYISTDTAALYDGMKDAGDAVPADTDGIISRINEYREQGYNIRMEREKAAEIEAYNHSGAGMVDSFLQEIFDSERRTFEPISSGLKTLDRAVGGGFIRQSVIMLGAAPGMGKTALISQICENIAKAETADILYINLEMSRQILLARSICRIMTAGGNGTRIDVNNILRGYELDAGAREVVNMAAEEYKATIARHLVYNPGEPDTDLDAIIQKIESEKRRLGHAPIVCLDYLQLITGRADEDNIAVIKRTMLTLKQYANDNNTIVFIITANNRDSMRTGESGLNSGRDSSNIEYGADLHLGLEYERVGSSVTAVTEENGEPNIKTEKGKDLSFIGAVKKAYHKMMARNAGTPPDRWSTEDRLLQEAYNKYCTRYNIRVNKNRYGDSDITVTLTFDGAAARFIELDTIHNDAPPAPYQPQQQTFEPLTLEDSEIPF